MSGAASFDAFLTAPGFEAALDAELGARARTPRWPGVVTAPAGRLRDPVFARQQLPGATLVKGESVRALAEGALVAIGARSSEEPFKLQAFVPDGAAYGKLAARAELVGETIDKLGRERWGRRRDGAWPEVLLVQAALVARTSLLVSAARPRQLPRGGWDLAPWPAGVAPVAEDRAAPSRAYGKLEEAFAWMGAVPAAGERCVDLGGSPGGWAWKALERGARVVSVDRAALAPPAAGHPALQMVLGNAFTYEPPVPADWLLCDVICEPPRTIDLVDRWMKNAWCRRVVATVKFKGKGGYGVLRPAVERLAAHGWRHLRIKHLSRHQNEVAIMAFE